MAARESIARYLTVTFLILIVTGSIVGILVPAGPGWDFANFYDTGRRVAAGQTSELYNPYSLIDGQPPQGQLGFYGTPISAWLYAPLSLFSVPAAMIAFKIQNTLAYFAGLILLFRYNRGFAAQSGFSPWTFAALFSGLSLAYQPLWTVYRVGGQSTPTVFLLLVAAVICHARSQFLASAACMVAIVLIKPAFVFGLMFLTLFSGWRFFMNVAGLLALGGVASLVTMGWEAHQAFLSAMAQGSQQSAPWFYNSSLYVVSENLKLIGIHNRIIDIAVVMGKGLCLAVCCFVIFKSRKSQLPETARRHFDIHTAVVFSLLVSQIVWEHYLTALFPLLVYFAASKNYFDRSGLWLGAAIFAAAAWQNLILVNLIRSLNSFDTLPGLIFIGIVKAAPLLLTLLFVSRYYRDWISTYRSPAWSR
jgi:hypothetical protein